MLTNHIQFLVKCKINFQLVQYCNNMEKYKSKKGFSLVELLVAIAIMSILASMVYLGINPNKRLKEARDNRRRSDVESILIAIHAAMNENNGQLPSALSYGMSEQMIGNNNTTCINKGYPWNTNGYDGCQVGATTCANLMTGTINLSKYITAIPFDPLGWKIGSTMVFNANNNGYSVKVATNGIVTVRSCGVEGTTPIVISR